MDILKRFIGKNAILLLAVLLAIISSHSLFHSGLLPTHDGEYHVIRFFEFDKVIRSGDLYPRWAPDLNNGFGVPLFNYVYPLPNYIASLFHLFGFGFIDTFKLNLFFATLVGGVFMYFWTKEFWGELGGFVSSVFYTFSPYHFLDIYVRGSVGEVWALAFFPAFLWSITKFLKERKKISFFSSSIFLSFVIFSHNILALMFFSFTLFYISFLIFQSKDIKYLMLSVFLIIFLSLGLSSIFWLPAIFERQYVRGLEVYDYSRNFPEFYQLIIPSWGTGFSQNSLQNQLSFQIGIANLLGIFMSIVLLAKKSYRKIILFFLGSFIIVFFLMLKMSLPIWQNFPFFNYFQFPWRFLSLEILFASFIAGSLVHLPKSKLIVPFLIILSIILGFGYTNIAYYLERNDSYYTTRSNFIDGTNSPGNSFNTIWFNNNLKKTKEKLTFLSGNGKVESEIIKSTNYKFIIDSETDSKIQVNTAYFPGWAVYVDGKNKKTTITRDGLFSFIVGPGKHQILIRFEDTDTRKLASTISLFSIIALFIYVRFAKIRK